MSDTDKTQDKAAPDHVCPERIQNIVGELFSLTVSQGHRIDEKTADAALGAAKGRLGEICLECLSGNVEDDEPAAAPLQPATAETKKRDENRKYFLLRMISCKLSHLFDTENNPNPLDRACSRGIDAYMHRLFSKSVYEQINARAGDILDHTGTGDTHILNAIMDNPDYKAFLENVLVRVAISFLKYEQAKDLFISDLNMAMPDNSAPLGHDEFKTIIRAMLSDVFLLGKALGGNDFLDYRYGANTAAILDRIADEFGRDLPPKD